MHRTASVLFESSHAAQMAFQYLNGLRLGGSVVRAGFSLGVSEPALQSLAAADDGEIVDSHRPALAKHARMSDLVDELNGGVSLSAEARASLMEKLKACYRGESDLLDDGDADHAISDGPKQRDTRAGSSGERHAPLEGLPGVISSLVPFVPSRVVVLKNAFRPPLGSREEALALFQDIAQECLKAGPVANLALDPEGDGLVFVRFETVFAAQSAITLLNGRFYDRAKIAAMFYPEVLMKAGTDISPADDQERSALPSRSLPSPSPPSH